MKDSTVVGTILIIFTIGAIFGGLQQCQYDQIIKLKCIEKTGKQFCTPTQEEKAK